jgi:hypothetical protein
MIWRYCRPGAGAGAALLLAAGASGVAAEKPFSLAITGAPGTRYTGQCTLITAAGESTIELAGIVPRHEQLVAEAIVCRIASAGSITVELSRAGSVSRATITGGTAQIAAR